jgi:hypothetical protein
VVPGQQKFPGDFDRRPASSLPLSAGAARAREDEEKQLHD